MILRKKILYYCLLLLLTLAIVEGMARAAYYLAYAEWYQIYPSESGPLANPNPGASAELALPGYTTGPRLVKHPYYGYTRPLPEHALNLMPPQQTRDDTMVIGILGGSVADNLTHPLRRAIENYFADRGLPRQPVVLSLSQVGMRQPQQLDVVSHLLAMGGGFDLIINLDGYNELASSYLNFQREVFPFFPLFWGFPEVLTTEEIALVGQIRVLREEVVRLRRGYPSSPFRLTAVYGLVNRNRIERIETRISQLNQDLTVTELSRSLERYGPRGNFRDINDVHEESVRVWYRGSYLLSRVAAAAGAEYYHFLQPNQYLPDAKPLSAAELSRAYSAEGRAKVNYALTYPLLVKYGKELQQQNINYFDLTGIFNDHPETLYTDDCCHLNQRENEILTAAIMQRLEPALLRRGEATGSAATTPTALAVAAPPTAVPESPEPIFQPDRAAVEPEFQVYRQNDNFLAYAKNDCASGDADARFFLHITPALPSDLPENRRETDFENRDFQFHKDGGTQINGQCRIERRLPDYPIAAIRTGQYNIAGEIWAVELSFQE